MSYSPLPAPTPTNTTDATFVTATSTTTAESIWHDVLERLRHYVPAVEFRTWFQQIKPLGLAEGVLSLGVPHSFAKEWLKNHYSGTIERVLYELGAVSAKVNFEVTEQASTQEQLFHMDTQGGAREVPQGDGHKDVTEASQASRAAEGQSDALQSVEAVSANTNHPAPDYASGQHGRLNEKYVFANFVVGPNNNLAHAASKAVAEAPGRAYNPLFIYGEAGLGKTHLMHAVGHAVLSRFAEQHTAYVTTEDFTNGLINAIRSDKMVEFRNRFRNIDVLLVDDVQFIAGKERTQEEFFHTFNALYESGKQIILSSDRPPKDIPTLEKRLRSRFEWGLITDLQAPELETRMAILKMNAEQRGVPVPEDVLEFIARQITTNVRELEGALVRTIVYASMNGVALNRSNASLALSNVFDAADVELNMHDILEAVAKHFEVNCKDILGKGRRAEIVLPRQLAMYLIRDLTEHSFPEIGQFFNGRDHSTVMYAVQKIEKKLEAGSELSEEIRKVKNLLY